MLLFITDIEHIVHIM